MSENLTFNQISTLASDLRAVSDVTYPVKEIISDEYNSTAHYVVGDYCIRNNILYRCNTDTPNNGEVWNADHWDESSVGEALSKIDWKLLWENASPTSTFGEVDISLDLSGYDFAYILYAHMNVADSILYPIIVAKGVGRVGYSMVAPSSTNVAWVRRDVIMTNTQLAFGTGELHVQGSASSSATRDQYVIPIKIYGIKSPISS